VIYGISVLVTLSCDSEGKEARHRYKTKALYDATPAPYIKSCGSVSRRIAHLSPSHVTQPIIP
jgi:hypothetical protein